MLPPTYVEGFHNLEAVKAMEYRPLGKTGLLVSKLSLGGAPFGNIYGSIGEEEAIEMIRQGIKQGINYIDTAPWYGQRRSETIIGKALKGIPRKAYYIATKVGRYELEYDKMFDYSKEKTRKSFDKSLELLGLDYVDVIQVHDVEFAESLDTIISQTIPELSSKVAEGKARYIGMTGYPFVPLKKCFDRSNINISTVLSYARYTLIDDAIEEYIPYFKERNIGVINGSPMSMGLLTNNGPQKWHPASDTTKKICAEAAERCKARNVELAKLALWYSMQHKDISTFLVGMTNLKELQANLDIVKNGITEEEQRLLKEIQQVLSTITERHWEKKEIMAYRQNLRKL